MLHFHVVVSRCRRPQLILLNQVLTSGKFLAHKFFLNVVSLANFSARLVAAYNFTMVIDLLVLYLDMLGAVGFNRSLAYTLHPW